MGEHPALVAATRHGLPVGARSVEVGDHEVHSVMVSAAGDRLVGFVVEALDRGTLRVPDTAEHFVKRLYYESLLASVTLEALAVRVGVLFDAAGVTWCLTKGPALAHLDYDDPCLRPFGDIDVLIHPDSWDAALAALLGAALERQSAEPRPGFDVRFGKGATFADADGLEVDVHRRLAIGRFGATSDPAELFDTLDELVLAGQPLPVLGRTGRFLHACFHATLGGFQRLRCFRDVAQLLLVCDVDWVAARDIARGWHAEAVLAAAVAETWARLELDVSHPAVEWARSHRASAGERSALRVFADQRRFRTKALTAVPVLPQRQVPAYLLGLAMPNVIAGRESAAALLRRAGGPAVRRGLVRAATGGAR